MRVFFFVRSRVERSRPAADHEGTPRVRGGRRRETRGGGLGGQDSTGSRFGTAGWVRVRFLLRFLLRARAVEDKARVGELRGETRPRFFAGKAFFAFDRPRRALEHARLDERLAPGRDSALEVRDGDALDLQRGVLALDGGAPTSAAHEHFGTVGCFFAVVGVVRRVRRARFRFFPSDLPALGAGASRVAQTTQRLELRERLGLTPRVHAERRGRGRAAERAREARLRDDRRGRVARGRAPRARGGRASRHRRWALGTFPRARQADRRPGAARAPPRRRAEPLPRPRTRIRRDAGRPSRRRARGCAEPLASVPEGRFPRRPKVYRHLLAADSGDAEDFFPVFVGSRNEVPFSVVFHNTTTFR